MTTGKKKLKICEKGHKFYKSSDCPTCPVCEAERKPEGTFLAKLSAPARRALEGEGVTTVKKLSAYRKKDILQLHGMGPASIPVLQEALAGEGLDFKE